MCWLSHDIPIKHIAEEDIKCYKVFKNNGIIYKQSSFLGFKYGKIKMQKLFSIFRDFKYVPYKKQEHINILYNYSFHYLSYLINRGYHSYETLKKAQHNWNHMCDISIVECIIPKGAEYFVNKDQEIVSSTIIVTDKIIC